MNVYTYFEPLGLNDAEPLVPLWKEQWKLAGFNPIVLGPADIFDQDNEEYYREFLLRVSAYPTVNPPGYELACYVRWFAFATRLMNHHRNGAKALMVDLDVFPTGITPDFLFGGRTVFLDPNWVPCAVASTWFGSASLIDALMEGPVLSYQGVNHTSDMLIFQERAWKIAYMNPICHEYEGWTRSNPPAHALLTHFPVSKVGKHKAAAIEKFLST